MLRLRYSFSGFSLDLAGNEASQRRRIWAGIAGATAVWFSQPAVIMVLGLGASLTLLVWRAPRGLRVRRLVSLAPVLSMWGASAIAAGLVGLASMTTQTRDFMHRFWATGLLPVPAWSAVTTHWPLNQLKALIGGEGQASLAYPQPRFYLLLSALGFWLLWRRVRPLAELLLAPIVVTIALAAARQYPFSDRLILFLVPSLLMAMAESIDWICRK